MTSKDGTVPYINRLQALGGPAPYEYCDGAGGLKKEGRYTIEASILQYLIITLSLKVVIEK